MDWRTRPTSCDYWKNNIDHTLYIDENGDSNLKHIIKLNNMSKEVDIHDRYFTITGCAIKKEDFLDIRDEITKLKYKYWENGMFLYTYKNGKKLKRVCFHSKEIRDEKGPFSNSVIDCSSFKRDLSIFINSIPITLFSSTIDKYNHCLKYENRSIEKVISTLQK